MIFDNDNKPIEQTNKGLNKPDGFGNIPSSGEVDSIKCPSCGELVYIKMANVSSYQPKKRYCPKCKALVGEW